MKRLLSLLLLLFTHLLFSQTPPQVQQDLMNFKPGELIVKLKDQVDAGVTYTENGKAISDFNIGELLGIEDKIESSEVMFHKKGIEASIVNSQKMKAVYLAKGINNPKDPLTMKNIFVLKTSNPQENILMLIDQIKNNPNIEYAEPNYIYSIDDFEVGDIITAEEANSISTDATITVDDPLYSSQTNITTTNIDDVWDQYTTGDGSQVIAILDTGVDYNHPDLEANIWSNSAEANGVEGYDDDGNGYVDDVRGWDFHHQTNTPLDDNMHGTHVAGIAGAVGNNGIGIAGATWNVKLMPLKVFQASGIGDSSTIALGVEYAYLNGATVLNMSFGSYAESATQTISTNYNLIIPGTLSLGTTFFIDKYGFPYCRGRIFETIEEDKGQYNDEVDIFWASGACLAIKNAVFKEVGGFDEDFFAHQEEIDLCWRIKNLGYSIKYTGKSCVYHVGGATLDKMNPKKTFYNFRNSLFMLVKNLPKEKMRKIVLQRMVLDGIAGLKFLFQGDLRHFLAVLKAHSDFYVNFSKMTKKRIEKSSKFTYFDVKSIVFEYFALKKTTYKKLI